MLTGKGQQWINIPNLVGGWNMFNEPSDIADNESPSLSNVVFDSGFLGPRKGSTLLYEKPDVETGAPLQIITARTSDGLEYLVAIYDNHFYVRHDLNEEWVRINLTYVPTETDLYYGYTVWNNGRGDDRLYLCNGIDNFGRWDVCVDQADGAQTAGAGTFVIDDATRFPDSGTLVIVGATSTFTQAYTSHTTTTFTLTGTLAQNVPDGASVTTDLLEKESMKKGKILTKHQLRLFTANYYGGETTINYSIKDDPEDFSTGTGISSGSTLVIADGHGEITGLHDFGEFAVIEKEDSLHSLKITVSDDLTTKLDVIVPLVSGQSVGPVGQTTTLKVLNYLYYLTKTEGIITAYPQQSGQVKMDVLSKKIKPYVSDAIDFSNSRSVYFDQKAMWAAAIAGGEQNVKVIVYDTLRDTWSLIDGWAVQDFTVKDAQLLYMDSGSGNVYRGFSEEYHDNNNPYMAEFFTKTYDFGSPSIVKITSPIYIQGYMIPATDLFIDVLYNEGGILKKQTFNINKDTVNGTGQKLFNLQSLTSSLGQPVMGVPILSSVILAEIGDLSIFRCYLGISIRHGHYVIGLRIYSNKQAFWGVNGLGFYTELSETMPSELFINPIIAS